MTAQPPRDSEILFNIVLVEPEIPQNTGNIGRTCVGTNCHLHLVGQLGFELSDKNVKRAGLDYWPYLKLSRYESYQDWFKTVPDPSRVFYFTTKTKQTYFQPKFQQGDWFVFGKETKGLDPAIIMANPTQAVTIPMLGPVRSLNLATSVAIAAYEGIRQLSESNVIKY